MLKNLYRELQQIIFGFGVPFVSTSHKHIDILLQELILDTNSVFVDIGCGDGEVISKVSQKFPDATYVGYESSPYPYSLAQKLNSIQNISISQKSVFDISLTRATDIYIYMVPYMTRRVFSKIQKECSQGTRVYIKSHTIPGILIHKTIPLSEKNNLHVYIM